MKVKSTELFVVVIAAAGLVGCAAKSATFSGEERARVEALTGPCKPGVAGPGWLECGAVTAPLSVEVKLQPGDTLGRFVVAGRVPTVADAPAAWERVAGARLTDLQRDALREAVKSPGLEGGAMMTVRTKDAGVFLLTAFTKLAPDSVIAKKAVGFPDAGTASSTDAKPPSAVFRLELVYDEK